MTRATAKVQKRLCFTLLCDPVTSGAGASPVVLCACVAHAFQNTLHFQSKLYVVFLGLCTYNY